MSFWSKQEVANQFVHMFVAFWLAFVLYAIFKTPWVCVVGLPLGVAVEVYQYVVEDPIPKLGDRFRDLASYVLGGLQVLVVIYV